MEVYPSRQGPSQIIQVLHYYGERKEGSYCASAQYMGDEIGRLLSEEGLLRAVGEVISQATRNEVGQCKPYCCRLPHTVDHVGGAWD